MKKLLLTFLIAFITALGLNATVTSPYKHTFASGELSAAAGKKTLDGVEWSWTDMKAYNFESANSKRGVQIGSKSAPQTEDWSISTTGISGTITAVKVNTSVASSGGATVKVSVGGTAFKIGNSESKSFTNTNPADYEFTGSASGEIVITMKSTKVKAMYLKSISVTFTTGGGSSETKELGPIMMGSTEISTDETNPTTAKVKGGGIISFTSANAASISVYTLPYTEGDKPAASEGSPSVTWTAPAAKESEQTVRLKVVSKLGTDTKEAFVTVTVPVKSNVSDDFTLITDAGDLYDGMEMYIVSGTKALSTTQNDNNRGQTDDVTINNGILTPIPSAQLITLEATNVTDKPWKFNVGDSYLYAASSSKNYLRTSASPSDNNEKATISIATNGNATITFQGTNTHNVLKYNSNSKLFSCYEDGQTEVQIYAKKTMTAVEPGEVTSMPAAVEGVITINKNEEITFSSKDAAKLQVSTQLEPVVGSSYKYTPTEEGKVTITPIDSEGKVYTEKAATFTIKFFKGLVDGTISYKTNTFTYTIGSEATLPELVKEPADVDVEYSISHERVENGVAVYNPATIDEQGNITVNTPGIVTVTATVKADRSKTASYVLEIQSLKEAEIAGTGSAIPTGNEYNKINGKYDMDGKTLYAILSCCNGKVYAMTPKPNVNEAGNEANDGFLATVVNNNATELADKYTIDNPDMALFLYDANLDCFTYNDNGTTKYLVEASRHLKFVEEQPSGKKLDYNGYAGNYYDALEIDDLPLYCNPTQGYFNTFSKDNENFNNTLFNCFLYKVGTAMSSASTVKAPVVHITGGNVYYSPDGEWYWGTEDENNELSFANETAEAQIYYTMTSATPSSANVRAMANSATVTEYSTPFKKRDLDGMKITFWAVKDGQKSAVETLNFNIKTGIEDIDVENAEAIEEEGDARYFNLQGLEVKNPGEGIYIRVANGKATKILKK